MDDHMDTDDLNDPLKFLSDPVKLLGHAKSFFKSKAEVYLPFGEDEILHKRVKDYGFTTLEEFPQDGDNMFYSISYNLFGTMIWSTIIRKIVVCQLKSYPNLYRKRIKGLNYLDYCNSLLEEKKPGDDVALKAACDAFRVKVLVMGVDYSVCWTEYSPKPGPSRKVMYLCKTNKYMKPMIRKRGKIFASNEHISCFAEMERLVTSIESSTRNAECLEILQRISCLFGYKYDEMDPACEKLIRLERLKLLGFACKDVSGDGNCLMRAISHQIYGDEEKHSLVRAIVVAQLRKAKHNYAGFCEYYLGPCECTDFASYAEYMSKDRIWGDQLCMQAVCDAYQLKVVWLCIDNEVVVKEIVNSLDPFYKSVIYVCTIGQHMESMHLANED